MNSSFLVYGEDCDIEEDDDDADEDALYANMNIHTWSMTGRAVKGAAGVSFLQGGACNT